MQYSAEGSGWTALRLCGQTHRLLIMQIEKTQRERRTERKDPNGLGRLGARLLWLESSKFKNRNIIAIREAALNPCLFLELIGIDARKN